MSIIKSLSSSQDLKGNKHETELAKEISESNKHSAVKELIENLKNKDKKIQSDCACRISSQYCLNIS